MGFHVSVVKRVGKEVECVVWANGMSLSLPLDRFIKFLIEESGVNGDSVRAASDAIVLAMKESAVVKGVIK